MQECTAIPIYVNWSLVTVVFRRNNFVERDGNMEYKEALRFIEDAGKNAGEMGLEAISNLLEELGHPEESLTFIHVGGTNGKGSVAAYLSFILASAGYKVGRYISPTIRGYRERIQILSCRGTEYESCYISKERVEKWITRIKEACMVIERKGKKLPSPFEIETAMGFLEFVEEMCDVVVLEVGMGGRTDATNIIKETAATVLTSISMDHMQVLGNTLTAIAREKAGIIKQHGNVVAYDYDFWSKECGKVDEITPVLVEKAREQQATITFSAFSDLKNELHDLQGITFDYKGYQGLHTPLLGENQVKNAALAIETAEHLQRTGWNITREHIFAGINNTKWHGRFEVIKENPVYIVDGAHNPDAARSLEKSIGIYLKEKKLLYIVGILADKDYDAVLSFVGRYADKIITVTPDNDRALSAKELEICAEKYCSCVAVGGTMEQALALAQKEEAAYDAILIFGSLYSLHSVYAFMEQQE